MPRTRCGRSLLCHSDRSEAQWRNPGTFLHRTNCGRSLHSADAPVGMTETHVMTTEAKRSGGILAPSCLEPAAVDPSIPLRSSRDDRNACHSDRSEAKWRNPGTPLPRTNCGRSLHSAYAPVGMTRLGYVPVGMTRLGYVPVGMTGMYDIPPAPPPSVIPTEAKRSGGILALPRMEPAAVDPSIPLTLQSG